jgi:UDP-N-acetylmuramoylalanine--D-glutamate ligase
MEMDVKDKNVLIVGLGKTGVSTARFLKRNGANVTVTDSSNDLKQNNDMKSLSNMGIQLEVGYHSPESFEQAELIVLSPGVPHTIAPVEKAKKKGTAIIGEIELASRFIKEPIVAVTGTNGKTTTTTLLGEMLTQSGLKVFVGGNIGKPLIDYVDSSDKADVIAAEVSSFQLDTVETFRPTVGALLNIAEDHMDRYDSFNEYSRSKCRLFENQKDTDVAIINFADPMIQSFCKDINSKKWIFSYKRHLKSIDSNCSAMISDKDICFTINDEPVGSIGFESIKVPGLHNYENIAAAGLATLAVGGKFEGIQLAINTFKGLPHRLEYIHSVNGVRYFNDSKATNAHAVEKALDAFSAPVILIMGGRNKDVDFHVLEKSMSAHVKHLIVIGEAKKEIQSVLGHITRIEPATSMDDAVLKAHQSAVSGDVVLLSPACASFDMYKSYVERGNHFREAVNRLIKAT